MNTIRNIRPAIARTRTTSIIVKAGFCEELFHLLFLVGKAWASGLEYWLEKERWFSSGVSWLLWLILLLCLVVIGLSLSVFILSILSKKTQGV